MIKIRETIVDTEPISVLDHGFIRLIDAMGNDLSVARAARVSYNAAWRAGENEQSDERLIRYLWRNRHTSPFEHVTFTFEVKAPIFIFRQWHRHRTMCLAGTTPLIFNRPCDGKAYVKTIAQVTKSFSDPAQKARLLQMNLRGSAGHVNITDAWFSGQKPAYRLRTAYGEVTCSADHLFKTPEGSAKLADSPPTVTALVRAGEDRDRPAPVFTTQEFQKERWRTIAPGYEVSDLGRVRSYYGQGTRHIRATSLLKKQTINAQGRAVVTFNNVPYQISKLVATAFLEGVGHVLHKDDNPLNNRLSNLYYGSAQNNSDDQLTNGGRTKLREVPVKVTSIERVGYADTFDISVTGDHWFSADNLIVHNSYSEVSARYSEFSGEYYLPAADLIGLQSATNKQGRTFGDPTAQQGFADRVMERRMVGSFMESAFTLYRQLLARGWPRELARTVLPLATYSQMFCTVNLLNLLKFLTLRCDEHAQYEIQVYANAMKQLIRPYVPVCLQAWEDTP